MNELVVNFRVEARPTSLLSLCKAISEERLVAGRVEPFPKWSNDRKSMVVESVLLHQGVGVIYIKRGATQDRLMDGNTRLFSLYHYLHDHLTLSGLKMLESLNLGRFSDLSRHLQRRMEDTLIDVREFHPDVSDAAIAAFLMRLDPDPRP
jgi:hypothetical protein